jgi:hypothetical protein
LLGNVLVTVHIIRTTPFPDPVVVAVPQLPPPPPPELGVLIFGIPDTFVVYPVEEF